MSLITKFKSTFNLVDLDLDLNRFKLKKKQKKNLTGLIKNMN
jgi:hypothetical protein